MIEQQLGAVAGLRCYVSSREGGVSEGGCASLNLGYHVGDDPARVTENRRRLASRAGYAAETLVCGQQVHGTQVARVTAAERGRGALSWEGALPETDGLLVAAPEVPVAILVADCAPVLIVDPVRRALAAVHAGWRGALGRIASGAARMLMEDGARPEDLVAYIGPTLCTNCLEVGPEVADAVRDAFGGAVIAQGPVRPHLDIRAMIRADLAGAGVASRAVAADPVCTRCGGGRYFSHRGQQGQAGRFALLAWWER